MGYVEKQSDFEPMSFGLLDDFTPRNGTRRTNPKRHLGELTVVINFVISESRFAVYEHGTPVHRL